MKSESSKTHQVAVAVIHGMGVRDPHFDEGLKQGVFTEIQKEGLDPQNIHWKPIYWKPVIEKAEDDYWNHIQAPLKADVWNGLRYFVVNALGDAAGYHGTNKKGHSATYHAVQGVIRKDIRALSQTAGGNCPLIVMAHSLGGIMITDYIWDIQNPAKKKYVKLKGLSAFEKFETLAGVVTFGSNISLFTFAYNPVQPIEFPYGLYGKDPRCQWLNYYDPNDVLGFPLKGLNKDYAKTVTQDIQVKVGGIPLQWTPISHLRYWTDPAFVKPVSGFIARFLRSE